MKEKVSQKGTPNIIVEMLYNKIIHTSMDGFWRVNLEGKILEVNDVYAAMSGYSVGELLELNISQLEAKESEHEVEEHIKKNIERGWDRFESIHKRKDGTTFNVEISTTFLEDISEFVVFVKDISDRKKTENRIKEALNFNQLIYNASPVGMMVFKESGPCVKANPAAEPIVGASVKEMLKLNYLEMDSYKKNSILTDMKNALMTGDIYRKEVHTINTFGHEVWFEGIVSTFEINGEKHILYIFDDIMDRKKVEEKLQNYHKNLEEKVAERTQKLQTVVNAMAGRENRMAELKKVIEKLRKQLADAGMTPVADDPLRKTD